MDLAEQTEELVPESGNGTRSDGSLLTESRSPHDHPSVAAKCELPERLELIDARPLIARREKNTWKKAEDARDQIYDDFLSISNSQQIDALVLKTNPAVYPPKVRFEAWLPTRVDSITERFEITVSIDPKPFHQHELEFNVYISDHGKEKDLGKLSHFSTESAKSLVLYLLRKEPKPKYYDIRIRRSPAEFWFPKNRIGCIKFDWIAYIPAIVFPMGLYGNHLVAQWLGSTDLEILLNVFLLCTLGGFWRWTYRRDKLFRSSGKPLREPRSLILVDTWQTIIFGGGPDSQLVDERLSKALEKRPTEQFHCNHEQHWAWGLDGKEERDQIVVSFNRAILFVQIYQYGEGLYIGWDAHVNLGQWIEHTVAEGIDRITWQPTAICTVVPGLQMISRYDLADLNCLIEWTHGQITQLIKRFIAERNIDQEVDFKILRGDRDKLLSEGGREKARTESASWETSPEKFSRKTDTKSIWVGAHSGKQREK